MYGSILIILNAILPHICRTPQAVHVFMSTFAFLVPPYYSPSFAQVARNIDSLAFGILFALIVTLSLSALLNSIHFMEDPFGKIILRAYFLHCIYIFPVFINYLLLLTWYHTSGSSNS